VVTDKADFALLTHPSIPSGEGKLFVLDKNLIPESSSSKRENKGEGFWEVKAH
tara:strand:- start:31218 stop:31376 length:159 start_codon:yes stop_codon:yes gene_type:complete